MFRPFVCVRNSVVIGTVMTLGVLGTTPITSAAATTVKCGEVISSNTTLSADIGPCPGDGIIIGANDITLNLAGHHLTGSGVPSADSVGIHLSGRRGVAVTGGEVSGFATGVAIEGGAGNTVSKIFVHDNVGLQNGNFGDGIGIFGSSDNIVTENVVDHNGPFEGIGVFGNGVQATGNSSQRNQVLSNVVKHSNLPRDPGAGYSTDVGINLGYGLNGPSFTTVRTNTVSGGGFDGIVACSESGNPCVSTDDLIVGNLVRHNGFLAGSTVAGYGEGIRINAITPGSDDADFSISTRIKVADNKVTGNASDGIFVASRDNKIVGNDAAGNNAGHQGLIFDLRDISSGPPPDYAPCDHNFWRNNTWGPYFNDDPSQGPVGFTPFGSFDERCTAAGGTGPRPGFLFSQVAARESVQHPGSYTAPSQRRMPTG